MQTRSCLVDQQQYLHISVFCNSPMQDSHTGYNCEEFLMKKLCSRLSHLEYGLNIFYWYPTVHCKLYKIGTPTTFIFFLKMHFFLLGHMPQKAWMYGNFVHAWYKYLLWMLSSAHYLFGFFQVQETMRLSRTCANPPLYLRLCMNCCKVLCQWLGKLLKNLSLGIVMIVRSFGCGKRK